MIPGRRPRDGRSPGRCGGAPDLGTNGHSAAAGPRGAAIVCRSSYQQRSTSIGHGRKVPVYTICVGVGPITMGGPPGKHRDAGIFQTGRPACQPVSRLVIFAAFGAGREISRTQLLALPARCAPPTCGPGEQWRNDRASIAGTGPSGLGSATAAEYIDVSFPWGRCPIRMMSPPPIFEFFAQEVVRLPATFPSPPARHEQSGVRAKRLALLRFPWQGPRQPSDNGVGKSGNIPLPANCWRETGRLPMRSPRWSGQWLGAVPDRRRPRRGSAGRFGAPAGEGDPAALHRSRGPDRGIGKERCAPASFPLPPSTGRREGRSPRASDRCTGAAGPAARENNKHRARANQIPAAPSGIAGTMGR